MMRRNMKRTFKTFMTPMSKMWMSGCVCVCVLHVCVCVCVCVCERERVKRYAKDVQDIYNIYAKDVDIRVWERE